MGVLGLRTDSMGDDYDKFRPEQTYRPEPPARKKFDFDASPPPTAAKFVDDDDTDAMINNLKKMTTRKAATDIVSAAEKEFEPVNFAIGPNFTGSSSFSAALTISVAAFRVVIFFRLLI